MERCFVSHVRSYVDKSSFINSWQLTKHLNFFLNRWRFPAILKLCKKIIMIYKMKYFDDK